MFKRIFILILCFISFSSVVFADLIPENSHRVNNCMKIVNVAEFTDAVFVGVIQDMGGDIEVYEIDSEKCLNKGYKFNGFHVYALPKAYADTIEIGDIKDESDSNVFSTDTSFNVSSYYTENSVDKNLISDDSEYTIAGFKEGEFVIYESKRIYSYEDGSSEDVTDSVDINTEGLSDKIEDFVNTETWESDVFSDVSSSHVYSSAIRYVKSHNMVNGYPDGTFKPEKLITRAEFTKILIEAKYENENIESCISTNINNDWSYVFFEDVPKTEWYAKYVCVAKHDNIINGYPDETFKPNDNINFVEATKIFWIFTHVRTPDEGEEWYAPYVAGLEDISAIPLTIDSYDHFLTRGEMAEMIYRLSENVKDKESRHPSSEWGLKIFNEIH